MEYMFLDMPLDNTQIDGFDCTNIPVEKEKGKKRREGEKTIEFGYLIQHEDFHPIPLATNQ